jgi:5-methylcytosine-specific restriction endonuclease McrA
VKFQLEETNRGISDEELLDNMRRCAKAIGGDTITRNEYKNIGKAASSTVEKRFGSWGGALKLAGLQPSRFRKGIADEELFKNIKSLWIGLGRQPRYTEVKKPSSQFSNTPYENRFGSWTKALKAFVVWVNSDCPEEIAQEEAESRTLDSTIQRASKKRRTCREVSERQRFRILVRDGFRCVGCGASPLTQRGIELHVDHVLPWSKGGDTTDDNLETKCKRCNLGKGNAFDV